MDSQGVSTINNALKYVPNLNPKKCVQCMFFLKDNAVTDADLKATINDNALSTVRSVAYLGVTFWIYAEWTAHVEEILRKCVRLEGYQRLLSLFANFLRHA